MVGAMILAAGRGERMRPLTDTTAKPLLQAGGRALIEWQIASLTRAGFRDIAINASHHADKLTAALGDGAVFGARIRWSLEREPLEYAALPPDSALAIAASDATPDAQQETLWARRGVYRLGARPILVQEVFLPALLRAQDRATTIDQPR